MAEKKITERPMPGQRVVIQIELNQNIVFEIDLTRVDIRGHGKQIAFTFPNNGQVVLDFSELETASLPNIILADGTTLDIQEYLTSLNQAEIEPAAGPGGSPASGGVGV